MDTWSLGVRRLVLWSYAPLLTLAVSVFLVIFWGAYVLWNVPHLGFEVNEGNVQLAERGIVTRIEPNGPAAQSLLRVGDQILRVNNRSITETLPNNFDVQAGDVIVLSVQRGQHIFNTSVTALPPPVHVRGFRTEPLLIALTYWTISFVIWALRPFHTVTRLFFLVGQVTAAMLVFGTLSSIRWPASVSIFYILLVLVAALALHFCSIFPEPLPQPLLRRTLLLTYGGALGMIASSLVVDLILVSREWSASFWGLRRLFVAILLAGTVGLLLRPTSSLPIHVLRRRRLLVAGMVSSLTPLLLLSLVPEGLLGRPIVDYAWTFPLLVLLPLSFAYAIHQGELGKIDFLLNRSFVFLLLTALLLTVYASTSLVLHWVFPAAPDWLDTLLSGGLAVAVGLSSTSLRSSLQHWTDRLFYGGWYDYRSVVRTASVQLSQANNRHQLVTQLMTIARSMRFQQAAVLWADDTMLVVQDSWGYTPQETQLLQIPSEGRLAQYLKRSAAPRWQEQVRHEVPLADLSINERQLVSGQVYVWLPLVSHGRLHGALVANNRYGEMLLDQEDIDILTIVARQASMASDNVVLVDALRTRLADVERMGSELNDAHHRLAESQEEKHLSLARELHDTIVQQLLGVTYQLVDGRRQATAIATQNGTATGESLANHLESIRKEILVVIRDLRVMIGQLRPPGLEEFGLVTALEGYISRIRREQSEQQLEIKLDLDKTDSHLPMPIALCLFRVVQEGLRNAQRHAQANQIMVALHIEADCVALFINDNGCGFVMPVHLSELTRADHFGIIGMAERVAWIGGEFSICSEPGAGTCITVRVPMHHLEKKHEPAHSSLVSR